MEEIFSEVISRYQTTEEFAQLANEAAQVSIDLAQIKDYLIKYNQISRYLSITNILKIRQNISCKKNFNLYSLCMQNIKDLLTPKILKLEIENFEQKYIEFLFRSEINLEEADSFLTKIKEFLTIFKFMIPKKKFVLIDTLILVKDNIRGFLKLTLKLKNKGNKFITKWEEDIKIIFDSAKRLKHKGNIDFVELYSGFMQEHIRINFNEEQSESLIKFIDSNKTPIHYPGAYNIAIEIENKILRYCYESISNNQTIDTQIILYQANQIKEKFKFQIRYHFEFRPKTLVYQYPDTDQSICCFLSYLLDLIDTDSFLEFYRFQYQKTGGSKNCVSLSLKFQLIFKFPDYIKYILFEIMLLIIEKNLRPLYFFCNKVKDSLLYKKIDHDWAEDFIRIACTPLFSNILNKFKKSQLNLEFLLRRVTPDITLMKMPKNFYGITLKNLTIAIKYFVEGKASKGATFAVYLHELGHYLQRADCVSIEESSSPMSEEHDTKEGGDQVEVNIFGEKLKHITYEAAEYLVSENLPSEISDFQKAFQKLNVPERDKKVISLNKTEDLIYLGQCGSVFDKRRIEEQMAKYEALIQTSK